MKAFDGNGTSSYATVLNGLNWIFANRLTYNIRVLNLSFAAKPQSFYWNDPIDQAVMKLWQAGVVVVASAGNWGPTAQTIGVPGNVPYIITVGAMTEQLHAQQPAQLHRLTSILIHRPDFPRASSNRKSWRPAAHIVGEMDEKGRLASQQQHPEFALSVDNLFIMSGTSQAAAVVSGSVALMLQANSSPDTWAAGEMQADGFRAPRGRRGNNQRRLQRGIPAGRRRDQRV